MSVYSCCCVFRYGISPETFVYTLVCQYLDLDSGIGSGCDTKSVFPSYSESYSPKHLYKVQNKSNSLNLLLS
jgi:hypothetical protein